MTDINEFNSEMEPGWEERGVHIPMSKEDYDEAASNLETILKRLIDAEIAKKRASDCVKEIESERDGIVSRLASKKKYQKLPSQWQFDWNNNEKRLIAILPSRDVLEVQRTEITEQDRQTHLNEEKTRPEYKGQDKQILLVNGEERHNDN